MGNSSQMWMLFVEAKTWRCRPSELLAIDDDYVAYCLDQAVGYFGRELEHALEQAGSGAKDDNEAAWRRKVVIDRWLGDESEKPRRGTYADPAAMF